MLQIFNIFKSFSPVFRWLSIILVVNLILILGHHVFLSTNKINLLIPNTWKNSNKKFAGQNHLEIRNIIQTLLLSKSITSSQIEILGQTMTFLHSRDFSSNKSLETTVECVGPSYNQSCLFRNLYYVDSAFLVLTVNGSYLPLYSVRPDAFNLWPITPSKRIFPSYADLEKFVRTVIDPKVLPSVTVYFSQYWHHNIAHALFDGLYPAYAALIRFPPRHLQPFRILAGLYDCEECWSEDVYARFAGLGLLKKKTLDKMSIGNWFMFEEIVMGSGTMCQRCTQPNLQLPGGVELDGSRLFRDRMYQQHGLLVPVVRHKSSSEHRTPRDVLLAYFIDNKRYTDDDRKEIDKAINEINNYTNTYINRTTEKLPWPLVRVSYLYYNKVKAQNNNSLRINASKIDSRSPTYELIDNNFIAQLRNVRQTDIHISGPGTGQMYQTFLPDGSVSINIGGIRPWGTENTNKSYTSFLEQHMTSGAPYIKGLYYPINDRPKGIKKDHVVQLIRQASELIVQGFSLPVNPRDNLAPDGKLFVEMCEKDKAFCDSVTIRSPHRTFRCLDSWVEDFVHEHRQWNKNGFVDNGKNITGCPFNHTLLHELRNKYGIKHIEHL